jgi:MarR-like DNA-binding transcriptional regulator SgrR of sgrS sRNA
VKGQVLRNLWIVVLISLSSKVDGASRPSYGGSLRVTVTDEIDTTDPILIDTVAEMEAARQIHETLLRMGSDGAWLPSLANVSPEDAKGQEWIIELRTDALFQDGTAVTSSDVLSSWERLLREPASKHWWLLSMVEGSMAFRSGKTTKISGIEIVNRYRLRVRLACPWTAFPKVLTTVPTAPLSASRSYHGKVRTKHPLGAGPFQVRVAGKVGGSMEMEAFLKHIRGRPFLNGVIFQPRVSGTDQARLFEIGMEDVSTKQPMKKSLTESSSVFHRMMFLDVDSERAKKLPEGFMQALAHVVDLRNVIRDAQKEKGTIIEELWEEREERSGANGNEMEPYFAKLFLRNMFIPTTLLFAIRKWDEVEKAVAENIQRTLLPYGVLVMMFELDRDSYDRCMTEREADFRLAHHFPLIQDPEIEWMGVIAKTRGGTAVLDWIQALQQGDAEVERVKEKAKHIIAGSNWMPLFKVTQKMFLREGIVGYGVGGSGDGGMSDVWLFE